ncbi:hypothetical protein LZQ00_10010 [Sphingobacterium sp. SRCM116780]|uniref:hypothetical protein n=1 Tax=Sphingobacterium sp. SRCM116780 TaxID=2907623 RepID=UPI001F373134|nr:hypothetical protein [Sphingobacterium sp. SRCM116780]UIR54608.1 hypothetical protein LZQ00_10010 [Sphingobacterium sp. SRCM116780]
MGLEAINFFFCSKELIKTIVESNNQIVKSNEKQYVYKKDDVFWIDLEIQNDLCLSIRITLCNPKEAVLNALDNLLVFLFSFEGGVLNNLNTKELFKHYNKSARERIFNAYENRNKVFEEIYGDYTAAVSSEEFYRIQRANRGIEDDK